MLVLVFVSAFFKFGVLEGVAPVAVAVASTARSFPLLTAPTNVAAASASEQQQHRPHRCFGCDAHSGPEGCELQVGGGRRARARGSPRRSRAVLRPAVARGSWRTAAYVRVGQDASRRYHGMERARGALDRVPTP